ncbi:MAG: DUF2799 domain-containing protein [Bdellovibrionaceae bacterium]|nr:DUF2799 domain-containing protein [Pseudobdellovibrionaceae bacterium]
MRLQSALTLVAAATLTLLLAGCASYFKRKECEAKNWYQYGYDLAMKGQRINNDNFVGECRKAEAEFSEADLDRGFKAGMSNYCKPEVVTQTGRSGEHINLDLCDPGQARMLRARHTEGVRLFCDPKNGYNVGTTGRVYNKICPAELEKAFLPEFNRGRKKYLSAMVAETQGKVADLDRRVNDKDREMRNFQTQLALIPPPQTVVNRTVTPAGMVEKKETSDPYEQRRENVQQNLRRTESEVRELQSQQQTLRDELYKYSRELQTIE